MMAPLDKGDGVELKWIGAIAGVVLATTPVSAAPEHWTCNLPSTDTTMRLSLDETTTQVAFELTTTGFSRLFTETAVFGGDSVEWIHQLPAVAATMRHRLDRSTGEMTLTAGDTGRIARWTCAKG